LKPDHGAPMPVDRAFAPDASPVRTTRGPRRLRDGLRRFVSVAGLAFSAAFALAFASLLALAIVRFGADWLDGTALWNGDRPRLHPRQIAMRELALDVIRQILLAGLVIATVRWQDGSAWRRTLALAPASSGSGDAARPGLPPSRLAVILLVWPLIHLTWVTGSAELFHVPIGRHTGLSPGLSAWVAGIWLGYVLVLAPIAEELLMRGLVYARARTLLSPVGTIVFTALLFALAHLTPAGFGRPLSLVPLALMLGWLRWRSGRLWPCILLHAWSNLATIAYVLWPSAG
jgi:membrane protease YdiL (CAAX protease family)